jgi:hypothetical protein
MTVLIKILTVHCAVYRLFYGPYCECNRDRGRADRLLVTIAIVAIGIQDRKSTELHKLFVSAVTLF